MSLDIYNYRELDEELDACKAYLVGCLDDKPCKDALGRAAVLWEGLRHVSYEQLTSVPLTSPAGFFVDTDGFPNRPFPSLPEAAREELCGYMEKRPLAVNIETTQRLALLGFSGYLANAEKEKLPAIRRRTRMKTDSSGEDVERVTDIVFTIRGHWGLDLCKKQIDRLLDGHPEWFLSVPLAMGLHEVNDPQRRLADLAAARLVHLLGDIQTAKRWTEAKRPHNLPFVGEKKRKTVPRTVGGQAEGKTKKVPGEEKVHTGPFRPQLKQWKLTQKRVEAFVEGLAKIVLPQAAR